MTIPETASDSTGDRADDSTGDVRSGPIQPLAFGIAEQLGTGWRVDDSPDFAGREHDAFLLGPDCLGPDRLSHDRLGPDRSGLRVARRRDRVHVQGLFPPGRYGVGGPAGHVISVRADRGPVVIAAEVRQRLLPAYLSALAAHLAAIQQDEQHVAARVEAAAQVAAVFGGHLRPETPESRCSRVTFHRDTPTGRLNGEVDVFSVSGETHLSLRGLRPVDLHVLADALDCVFAGHA